MSDGNGLIARSPGGDQVATKVGSAAAVSVGLDRHGDVVSTFDPVAGTVEGSVEYDPFGVVTGSGGVSAGNIGLQGAYTDPVSKLVDMGARWYSPGMGRFVSRDTIRALLGTPVSLNMYTYANNDPLGFYDPDGHQSADTCERTGQCSRGDANGTRGTKPKTTPYKCVRHCPDGQIYGIQPPKSPGASEFCPDGTRKIDGESCPSSNNAVREAHSFYSDNYSPLFSSIIGNLRSQAGNAEGSFFEGWQFDLNYLVQAGKLRSAQASFYGDYEYDSSLYFRIAQRCSRSCESVSITLMGWAGEPENAGGPYDVTESQYVTEAIRDTVREAVGAVCVQCSVVDLFRNSYARLRGQPVDVARVAVKAPAVVLVSVEIENPNGSSSSMAWTDTAPLTFGLDNNAFERVAEDSMNGEPVSITPTLYTTVVFNQSWLTDRVLSTFERR